MYIHIQGAEAHINSRGEIYMSHMLAQMHGKSVVDYGKVIGVLHMVRLGVGYHIWCHTIIKRNRLA